MNLNEITETNTSFEEVQQSDVYKMDTYEDKMSFLALIHSQIAAPDDLYNVSGKEYVD